MGGCPMHPPPMVYPTTTCTNPHTTLSTPMHSGAVHVPCTFVAWPPVVGAISQCGAPWVVPPPHGPPMHPICKGVPMGHDMHMAPINFN